ncbi:class I SAM-dependent methyltransferase [[Mesomycoplasma] collis]|uniref:class I SAM-dependent methyltransferase n=1 Tax=[Mycoplasma] collis TaxID=2127 RepID=UPI000AA19ABF|nr:class I SAM-dependent methyltransferase [[Mycoplasma] collis]
MIKNIKKSFENPKTVARYLKATQEIKLWKSEQIIIKKYFKKKSKILELGTGTGQVAFGLNELNYKNITALDNSNAMIEQANKLVKNKNLNLKFLLQDACNLKFDNESFDNAIFAFNGWPGIVEEKNRIKVLKEVYRVLKKDGIFILSAHDRDELKYNKFRNLNLKNCPELKMRKYGDLIYKNQENICDFIHLYTINELFNLIVKKTKFKVLEIINRDKNFKESEKVKQFSDNTIFWILQK